MKKILLSSFILFIGIINGYATHNHGGDITYKYIGDITHPYRYHIIVTTYTKWLSSSSTDRCELTVYFGDGDTAIVPRTNGSTLNCPSAHDGVLVLSDLRLNKYEIDHDFPGNGTYIISMGDQNRNGGICNIPDSANQSFDLQAELVINPFLGNNSGPDYPKIPIISDSIGIVQYYNPGATEPDGDALYYELIPSLAFGAPIPGYVLPASSTSFTINSTYGTVIWNTPMMICEYNFAIKITEWRNIAGTYYYVGSTMQEGWNRANNLSSGISENKNEIPSVNVFPNPSTDVVNFSITDNVLNKNYSVHIMNSLGQIISDFNLTKNATIADLKPGIYFFTINSPEKIIQQGKFIVLGASVK
jgi:hypothetical protein